MEWVEGGAPLHHGYQCPEQPEKWYTPDSSAPQPGHLLPGCLPKREVSLCSRRGELRTPPPAWRSQCFPLRKGEHPSHRPGSQRVGSCSAVRKRSLASALVTVPGFLEGLLWKPHEERVRISQSWQDIWKNLVGASGVHAWEGTAAPRDPQPHRDPVGANSTRNSFWANWGWNYVYRHTSLFFLSSCPKEAESLVLLVLKTPK